MYIYVNPVTYMYIYIYKSSLSTLAGLSYHICGKLEVAFKASPSSQHQHCTDEAQKAETVLSAVSYIYKYIYIYIYMGKKVVRFAETMCVFSSKCLVFKYGTNFVLKS